MKQTSFIDTPNVTSPLKFYGSKRRFYRHFKPYLKELCIHNKIVSPFIGGGSFELRLAADGIYVYGYDLNKYLVNFWNVILTQPVDLVNKITDWYDDANNGKLALYNQIHSMTNEIDQAAAFMIINRKSWSGLTLNGVDCDKKKISVKKDFFHKFKTFSANNLTVSRSDFRESLENHKDLPAYLDPPYVNRHREYGLDGEFDHDSLNQILLKRNTPWLLSYNVCDYIHSLYKECYIKKIEVDVQATPKGHQKSEEFVISNFKPK